MIRKLDNSNYKKTNWSGGTTTELLISPDESEFKKLNFDVRISIATVDLDKSEFTKLGPVDRTLMVLSGEHALSINDNDYLPIDPFQQISFKGNDKVFSKGKATNFNVISRKGLKVKVESIPLNSDEEIKLKNDNSNTFLYLNQGTLTIENQKINSEASIFFNEDANIKATEPSQFIVVTF